MSHCRMAPRGLCARVLVVGLLFALSLSQAQADFPTFKRQPRPPRWFTGEHRWFVGGTFGYHTTEDTNQNNALLFNDPRPDGYVSREFGVEDTVSYGLHAGAHLTNHFSLQFEAGYFQGEVGAVDAFLTRKYPVATTINQANLNFLLEDDSSLPFPAGELTQIPVSVSGVWRFRVDRTFRPYLGAGGGMVFMTFEEGEDFAAMQQRMEALHIIRFENEQGHNITPIPLRGLGPDGKIPLIYPVSVQVDDSLEWHLTAGVEYEINPRMSLVADVRYTFFSEPLVVEMNGEDQVNIDIYAEEVWREDGSLRIFINSPNPPNPDSGPGPRDPRYECIAGTVGDFDMDGHADDLCYAESQLTPDDDYTGTFIVQGGEISLDGFLAQIGLRWSF